MMKTQQKPIESIEAEQTLLGAILFKGENISEVIEKIRAEDFYYSNHRLIFEAITDLEEAGAPIDYNSVSIALKEAGNLEKVGGIKFLVELADQVGFASNLHYFVEIVHEKSSLRRLSEITAKAHHACFNGHKFGDVLVQIQEKIAELSAGAGVKIGGNLASRVREWIKMAPGQFEVRQVYNDLGIMVTGDKKSVLMALGRAEKEALIEKMPGRRGQYRIVETRADKIDVLHADACNWLDIKLPLEIEKYVRIFPTNIIVIAGEKGSGKTAMCLDAARLNKDKFHIRYLSSEMAAEELRARLDKFGLPIEDWTCVDFRSRRSNFADVIDPDAINIIDYLEKYDQFWTIAADIGAVFDKLSKGICIIAIQKDKGAESGRGGMFTREKCRLHIALNKQNQARIDDVKIFAMEGYNPNGLILKYKLIQGARFQLAETTVDTDREGW